MKIIIAVLLLLIGLTVYIFREMGASPSQTELASFEKYPYFKNGQFQSYQPWVPAVQGKYEDKMNMLGLLLASPNAPDKKMPQVNLDRSSFSSEPGDHIVYWLGHSSTILELNKKRIAIDLVFGNASPVPFTVRRFQDAPIKRNQLPDFDYLILTHNHYDHAERKTIQSIRKGQFIVPYGVKTLLRGWGIEGDRITELGWNETFEADGFKITAVEGIHFSGRSFADTNKTVWNSYIIQTPEHKIFWGGDGGYGKHFAEIGQKYGPFDWVALEIDAWNGGWPGIHLFPQQVVQAAVDLRAKRVLPIHWGAYDLGYHPWQKSINRVVENSENKPFKLMTPMMGEKLIPGKTETEKWWLE